MAKAGLPPFARFVEKIKINPETSCWEWQGCKSLVGYGQFRFDARRAALGEKRAPLSSPHRFAYIKRYRERQKVAANNASKPLSPLDVTT